MMTKITVLTMMTNDHGNLDQTDSFTHILDSNMVYHIVHFGQRGLQTPLKLKKMDKYSQIYIDPAGGSNFLNFQLAAPFILYIMSKST